jgi:hypothetical protein
MFSTDDPLVIITEQLDRLAAEDRASWSGPAQTERAVGLLQVHGMLEAEAARAAGDWQASGAWMVDGCRHANAALARRSGRSATTCRRVLSVGRLAHDHELTGKALASGDLPVDHAATLARAIGDREEIYGDYEQDLIGPAARLDHRSFRKLVETWKHIADDLLGRDREGEAHTRRGFSISELLDGISDLQGTAEAEGAAIIRAAVDAYTVLDDTDLPGGGRTARQRRYDALIDALSASINGAVPGRPKRSTDVIVSYELSSDSHPPTSNRPAVRSSASAPSPPPCSAASPPTPTSAASSPAATASPSTSAPKSTPSPQANAAPSATATTPASGPAVTSPGNGPKSTTASNTTKAAPPPSKTADTSAPTTTANATKAGPSTTHPRPGTAKSPAPSDSPTPTTPTHPRERTSWRSGPRRWARPRR